MSASCRRAAALAFLRALGVLSAAEASPMTILRGTSVAQIENVNHKRQFPDDGYEYGDRELHARDADSSDYSVHQFLAPDEAREGTKDSSEDQALALRRSKALAKEDHFNSEDTPSTDNFLQISSNVIRRQMPGDSDDDAYEYGDKEVHSRDADSSDYSVHQFLAADDARDGSKVDDDQALAMRRSQALEKDDHFNSEDTPSTDNFLQIGSRSMPEEEEEYEYGDKELHARDAQSGDYSVHQFLAADDARDGSSIGDNDQAFALRRAKGLERQDHFNSEDTPSQDTFLQLSAKTFQRRHAKRQLPGDSEDDGFEYGDKEFHARDADSSDYSVHQFLATDDARDGTKIDDDQAFAMRKSQAMEKEDHFNSEDTPSTGN